MISANRGRDSTSLVQRSANAKNWNPDGYLDRLPIDPWGNPYIIHVGAMEKDGSAIGGAGAKGWILSAGPNGVLETNPTDPQLCGGASPCDDRGFIFFTKE